MISPDLLTRVVFLDIEASSLAPDSWPVEIGLSQIDCHGRVQTDSRLIRPAAHWPQSAWSEQSARVHGLSRACLADADPAGDVALWTRARIAERVLVSDAPAWDLRWLGRLLEAAPGADLRWPIVDDFHALTHALFPETALDRIYERLARLGVPHRAGPDSARLAQGWVAGARTAGWLEVPGDIVGDPAARIPGGRRTG